MVRALPQLTGSSGGNKCGVLLLPVLNIKYQMQQMSICIALRLQAQNLGLALGWRSVTGMLLILAAMMKSLSLRPPAGKA